MVPFVFIFNIVMALVCKLRICICHRFGSDTVFSQSVKSRATRITEVLLQCSTSYAGLTFGAFNDKLWSTNGNIRTVQYA